MELMAIFFVDDCQIHLPTANIDETKTKVLALLSDIKTWMTEQKLKLNESKTELLLIKGNLRTNITLGISFNPELSF